MDNVFFKNEQSLFDLKGKKALVTGSTQGIGFSIAKCLSDCGAHVFVNGASNEEKVKKAAIKIENATPIMANLADKNDIDKIYAATGDVDILILNASVQIRKRWDEITDDEFDCQVNTNFRSSVKLIQRMAPQMLKNRWGRIITIGSVQQHKPHKDMIIYAALKAAQMNMTMNLAKQFAACGVTVNNVAPGVIETPRNEEALKDKEYSKKVLEGIPMGVAGAPEDCVGAVLLLCSEAGRYITGENIDIDGGMKL